jgi:predicted nucleotidyltransferase
MVRGFRDRDFIESIEGLIFCVIGNVHPRGRVISYLKYVPNFQSQIRVKWSRSGVSYGRILPHYSAMGVRETINFLKANYPQYLIYDDNRSMEFTEVPIERVKFHYKPEFRLRELMNSPMDSLEGMVRDIVLRLSSESGVDLDFFGVTGSILLGIHNPSFSDIDLVVYGYSNAIKVRDALKRLYSLEDSSFSLPKGEVLESWAKDIIKIHPLTFEEALLLYGKYKWNRALYRGRQFSVHPVKLDDEVKGCWECEKYRFMGITTIKARVVDSRDSIFIPATYIVDDVKVIDGVKPEKPISRVVSYEGLYMDLADPGDEIVVRGKLEEVYNLDNGESYCQVTVGSFEASGGDYIKPIKWLNELLR